MGVGGYREGSGRSKSGYYKGIYCGSTYELCWVIYNLDHSVLFERFPGKLEKNGIVYYPDFYLRDQNKIIEIKGYECHQSVDKKTKVAESFGYVVEVLRKPDLLGIFDYVEKTYNTKKFYTLYDMYKPRYSHVCDFCNYSFVTDRKIKTTTKFCNRTCSGRYRASDNHRQGPRSEEIKKKISQSLIGRKPEKYKRKVKQMWITDGVVNTRISIYTEIPAGFRRGKITYCK